MSRSVGVLKAPVSSGFLVTLNRPTSGFFGVHADADVVVLLVGEQHAVVAVVALKILKELPAALGLAT